MRFDPSTSLGERVLYPSTGAESNGMEDARFVRFVDDDGAATYYATYTAFDGRAITQQLLATADFASFAVVAAARAGGRQQGPGPVPAPDRRTVLRALPPRRRDERRRLLRRHPPLVDGQPARRPHRDRGRPCRSATAGPPIETADGWLVLTHGVGAMRTYSIGALLLDLDDPTVVIGRTTRPLITPQPDEQDGYVPNVVYSCGALRHGELLLVPFGIGDANVGFATFVIDDVLAVMREHPTTTTRPDNGSRADA